MLPAAEERARRPYAENDVAESLKFMSLVTKQIYLNLAVWYVFWKLLEHAKVCLDDPLMVVHGIFADVSKVLREKIENGEIAKESPELLVDVFLFFWLFERDEKARRECKSLMSDWRQSELLIDTKVVDLYRRVFLDVFDE